MDGNIIDMSQSLQMAHLSAGNGEVYVVKLLEGDADVGDTLEWTDEHPTGAVTNRSKNTTLRVSLQVQQGKGH